MARSDASRSRISSIWITGVNSRRFYKNSNLHRKKRFGQRHNCADGRVNGAGKSKHTVVLIGQDLQKAISGLKLIIHFENSCFCSECQSTTGLAWYRLTSARSHNLGLVMTEFESDECRIARLAYEYQYLLPLWTLNQFGRMRRQYRGPDGFNCHSRGSLEGGSSS